MPASSRYLLFRLLGCGVEGRGCLTLLPSDFQASWPVACAWSLAGLSNWQVCRLPSCTALVLDCVGYLLCLRLGLSPLSCPRGTAGVIGPSGGCLPWPFGGLPWALLWQLPLLVWALSQSHWDIHMGALCGFSLHPRVSCMPSVSCSGGRCSFIMPLKPGVGSVAGQISWQLSTAPGGLVGHGLSQWGLLVYNQWVVF